MDIDVLKITIQVYKEQFICTLFSFEKLMFSFCPGRVLNAVAKGDQVLTQRYPLEKVNFNFLALFTIGKAIFEGSRTEGRTV